MVKVPSRKGKKRIHQTLNESITDVSTTTATSASTSNNNINEEIRQVVAVDDDGEERQGIQESSVWKFATKVGSEKAKCNICQIGEYVEEPLTIQDKIG